MVSLQKEGTPRKNPLMRVNESPTLFKFNPPGNDPLTLRPIAQRIDPNTPTLNRIDPSPKVPSRSQVAIQSRTADA